MDTLPVTNKAYGHPESTKEKLLHTGASMAQNFAPTKQLCAHLHAFHTYASNPGVEAVPANHYCAHVNEDVRQCILYDDDGPNARLIGIEYMIKPHLFEQLDPEERKLWHSHVFEVKSGMLIMPNAAAPDAVWEPAETAEMKEVVELYGKVYHLWQTNKGHKLPMGEPKLMTSFTGGMTPALEKAVDDRDKYFKTNTAHKREIRQHIKEPELHPEVDYPWKKVAEE